jgi:PAS domain S-box-containing protein
MRIDRGGILLYANEAALALLSDWKLDLGNQVPQELNDPIQEVFKTGTTNTVELNCGGRIFSIAIGPTPDENEVNIYGVDITERKQAEEALQIAYKRLQEAQRIGNLGSVDWNLVTDEVILSDETRELIGWRKKNKTIFMKELIDLIKPEEKDRVKKSIYDIQAVRPLVDLEMGLVRPNGKEITVHMIAELIPDLHGQPLRMVGTLQDVTERKAAGDKILQLNADLEQRVEERTHELREVQDQLVRKEKLAVLGQLAGGVGHELRNPLGVISNAVYYLKMVQPEANEKIKKYHAMIEQELHNATRIVSDLLDYASKIYTEPKPGSVSELVEYTLKYFPLPASISIKIRIPADLPQVYADPLHVQQILVNLVTNACQAMANPSLDTKAGSATMSGRCKLTILAHLQKKMVAIAVKDTGIGILPENLPKLFEPLFSTKVTGIGLGLAVSKKLAEVNGGRIEVKSQAGKGSTFTLYLPAKADK